MKRNKIQVSDEVPARKSKNSIQTNQKVRRKMNRIKEVTAITDFVGRPELVNYRFTKHRRKLLVWSACK